MENNNKKEKTCIFCGRTLTGQFVPVCPGCRTTASEIGLGIAGAGATVLVGLLKKKK